MTPYRDITDEEWQQVAQLLPELRPRAELRGRPLANTRAVLNGVLWVMYSGATWSAMPRRYPSYQTCHRRFKAWHQSGTLKIVLAELYGAASEELCGFMEMRMRSHAKPIATPPSVLPAGMPAAAAPAPASAPAATVPANEFAVSLKHAA
ncbi:transposase [Trinickia terrae]|uniref:Transposase n=1 Tax=Trinickia terrae TaxID=2571161 RepID=A0A4U1HKD6_9BURK|nr:transposase [Trinickia terrae]TKC81671.1 transposase [Trinickia terrae]